MTNNEQKLSTDLHTKLGVKPSGEVGVGVEVTKFTFKEEQGVILVEQGANTVNLTPTALRALEAFAVKIGWRYS